MSHRLKAIFSKKEIIEKVCAEYKNAYKLDLDQGFALIPYTDALSNEISLNNNSKKNLALDKFESLSDALNEYLCRTSEDTSISYFETNYTGGTGNQSSILYINKQVIGPYHTKTIWDNKTQNLIDIPKDHRAINKVLYKMDVHSKYRDEFGTLGLPKYKSMDDIIKSIKK